MTWHRQFTSPSAPGSTSSLLTTRGSWARELYRLLNTEAEDDDLTKHDDSTGEAVLVGLQAGLDDAQEWLLAAGLAGYWVKRSSALAWSGTDAADGGRYTDLPSDFRRLAGDHSRSALVEPNGDSWGRMVEWEDRRREGDGYYLRGNDELWLLRKARPPSTLHLEYVERLIIPGDDTTAFEAFPSWALPLIPAYAAVYLVDESFVPGGPELEGKVARRLDRRQRSAIWQLRMSQAPRRIRSKPILGNRYWT